MTSPAAARDRGLARWRMVSGVAGPGAGAGGAAALGRYVGGGRPLFFFFFFSFLPFFFYRDFAMPVRALQD